MPDIIIAAEGPEAEQALSRATAFFEHEFGAKAEPHAITPEAARRGFDPAWLAVVLALPPAIVATMELSEKLRLIERTEAVLAEMRTALGKAGGVIRIGAKKTFDIATAKAREIIDALTEEDSGDS